MGIDKHVLKDFLEIDVDPGEWKEFLAKRNGALLGIDIVDKFRDRYVWTKGKEFAMADFGGLSLFMAGVFKPRDPAYRNVILADRVFLQEVDAARGLCNQIFVRIRDREETPAVIAAVDSLDFPVKTKTESARVALDQAIDDLDDMLRYAGYVIAFASLVILLCIANTISMSTYDRKQEIGILRAMGFDRPRILRLVLAESILFSLLGGAVGCLAAFGILSLSHQSLDLRGITVPIVMRPVMAAVGMGLSFAAGLAGGAIPALKTSRLNIVESLRNAE